MDCNHLSNNDRRRQQELRQFTGLLRAQQKELTPTMLQFHNETHVLRIEDDSHGVMTVLVRDRATTQVLHRVRFIKKPNQGVVYNFMRGDRLWFLAIEAVLLPLLEARAKMQADVQSVSH